MSTDAFLRRVQSLPRLGLGVSTEYGVAQTPGALDPLALRAQHAEYARFLEIGIELSKGLDREALDWVERGYPTTYHFLDINLDDPEDFDHAWVDRVRRLVERIRPAWLCGDAGLWHFGRRDRGHMLLLPPILSEDGAVAMAEGIRRLRRSAACEVLPENPPGSVYVGPLHVLDFFGRVCEEADTGMLLDCAHLAIFQRMRGHAPLTALDTFPLERVVELHVAGGTEQSQQGFDWVEDSHGPDVLQDTWTIVEHVASRAPNLKAVVFECERNPLDRCLPGFERILRILDSSVLREPS